MILTHLVMMKFLGGASVGEVAPAATFNNNIQNWMSPGIHLGILLFLYLRVCP